MASNAYVLLTVEPGETRRVVEKLREIPRADVHEVLGPYDIVVELESDSQEGLTNILRTKIRTLPGVSGTVTCIWI